MSTPEQIDREDHRDFLARLRQARKDKPFIRESKAAQRGPDKPNARSRFVSYRIPGKVLHQASNAGIADMLRRQILNRERAEAYLAENPPVVLVKDGVLTPEGIARGIKL